MLALKFKLAGVREWVRGFRDTLEAAVAEGLTLAAGYLAEDARANHRFTNRTGELEASIAGTEARGSFWRGTMHADVRADAPYAGFVEERVTQNGRWAYLAPAWERGAATAAAFVSSALDAAVARGITARAPAAAS